MFCWPSLQWCRPLFFQHPVLPVHSVYIWQNRRGGGRQNPQWEGQRPTGEMHHNLLLVQSFTFSSAATPQPESGLGCRCSGRFHQCPRWWNLPFCPILRHSYSSPTSGRKEKSRWEKRQGLAFALSEERVEPLGFTFFMLVPRLGYGGLLTLLQSTVSLIFS